MEQKVTKEEFIEAIENNEEGLHDYQLAEKLHITPIRFSQLKKKYKEDIRDLAKEMTIKIAADLVNMLLSLARYGDTSAARISAIKILLEIDEVYVPSSKHQISGDDKRPIFFDIINDSKGFKKDDKE